MSPGAAVSPGGAALNEIPVRGIWTNSEVEASSAPSNRERDHGELRASGLVDTTWYRRAYADPAGIDPVGHFLERSAA